MFEIAAPGAHLTPVPAVFVCCAGKEEGFAKNNAMIAAWTGIVNSEPPMVSVSIRRERYSHAQISQTGEFVLHPVCAALEGAAGVCGSVSGFAADKFEQCGLKPFDIPGFSYAKAIDGAALGLACRVHSVVNLPTHDVFIGEVVHTLRHPDFVRDGRFDAVAAGIAAFDPCAGRYLSLTDRDK